MTLLARIMDLTTAIEERVAAADWAAAASLDQQRRELLPALFAGNENVLANPAARTVIEQLRARTDGLAAAIQGTRRALAATADQLHTVPAAMHAYAQNRSRTGNVSVTPVPAAPGRALATAALAKGSETA